MKATLVFMSGLPFSGKTTVAHQLSRLLNLPILSYDHDIYAVHKSEVPAGTSAAHEFEIIEAIARQEIARRLRAGESLIFDDLCLDRQDRSRIVEVAQACGAHHILVFVDTPMAVIHERRQANIQTNGREHIADEKLEFDASLQEAPGSDEHAIVVTPRTKIEDVAHAIRQRS